MPYNYFEPDPEEEDWGVFSGPGVSPVYWNDPELARTLPRAAPQAGMGGSKEDDFGVTARREKVKQAAGDAWDWFTSPVGGRGPTAEAPAQQPQQAQQPPMGPPEPPPPEPNYDPGAPEEELMSRMPEQPGQQPQAPTSRRLAPIGGLQKTPPEFQSRLYAEAEAWGLDPNKVAAVMATESGFKNVRAANSASHTGLLQFGKNEWKKAAELVGSDVPWEDIPTLSPEEQIPYAMAYLKWRGVNRDDDVGKYKMATLWPAGTEAGDNYELYRDDPKAYAANRGLDKDGDGRVTRAEAVRSTVELYERGMAADPFEVGEAQAQGPAGQLAQPGQPGQPGQMGVAGDAAGYAGMVPPGMQLKGVQFTQRPLSKEEQAAQLGDLEKRKIAEQIAFQEATMRRAGAARQARMEQEQRVQAEKAYAEAQIGAEQQAAIKAQQKRAELLDKPLQKVDPKRYLRNMTTGQRAWGIAAMMFEGIGNAFIQMAGGRPNGGGYMELLQKAIDDDIEAQKVAIQTGEARRDNELMMLERSGVRRDQRIQAMQAMKWGALAKLGEVKVAELEAQGADTSAAIAGLQAIQNKYAEAADAFEANERKHQQIQLAPTPPVDPAKQEEAIVKAEERKARFAEAQSKQAEFRPGLYHYTELLNDPKLTEQLAHNFTKRQNTVAARNELNSFQESNTLLRKTHNVLSLWQQLENVQPDAQGRVAVSQLGGDDDAIGWLAKYAPNAVYIFGDDLDAYRKYVYDRLQLLERADWKTEPNGETIQRQLSQIYQGMDQEHKAFLMSQLGREVMDARANLYEKAQKDMLAYVLWNEPKREEQRKGKRAGRIEQ